MDTVRGRIRAATAIAAVLSVTIVGALTGIAVAEQPVHISIGETEVTLNGGFKPKALSKTKPTPITFNVSGDIRTKSGEHPPALKEFVLETDKNAVIDVRGVPVCKRGKLESTTTHDAEAACPTAILGSGHATAEIKFPDQPAVIAISKIIAFNGGFKGGVTTLYIHAFLTAPVSAAIVSTVTIKKIHKGPYGLLSVTTIPKIAGGSGSVTHFDLVINRHGVLTAKCVGGKLRARGAVLFSDGSQGKGGVVRPCTPKP